MCGFRKLKGREEGGETPRADLEKLKGREGGGGEKHRSKPESH